MTDGWEERRSYSVLGARRATRGLKPGHAFLEFAPHVRLKKSGIVMTGQVKRNSNLFFFVSWIGGLEQVQRTTVGGREGFEPCCLPLAFIGSSLTSRETKSSRIVTRTSVKIVLRVVLQDAVRCRQLVFECPCHAKRSQTLVHIRQIPAYQLRSPTPPVSLRAVGSARPPGVGNAAGGG